MRAYKHGFMFSTRKGPKRRLCKSLKLPRLLSPHCLHAAGGIEAGQLPLCLAAGRARRPCKGSWRSQTDVPLLVDCCAGSAFTLRLQQSPKALQHNARSMTHVQDLGGHVNGLPCLMPEGALLKRSLRAVNSIEHNQTPTPN